jgi:hypothetical protein
VYKKVSGLGKTPQTPQTPQGHDTAPPAWTDDRAWSPRFLAAKGLPERRLVLAEWVAAAGGRVRDEGGALAAELPELPNGLARAELLRRCAELGVGIAPLASGEARS